MNKRFRRLLPLLLAVAMVLSACGEFQQGVRPSNPNGTQIYTKPGGEVLADPFTVTLVCEGQPVVPTEASPITVQWSDGYSVHTAQMDASGVAAIGGLDGDYRITVEGLPEGLVYDPNAYNATNDDRNVVVEVHKLVPTTGKGLTMWDGDAIKIKNTGVYCVEVRGENEETFFIFSPTESGVYSVRSWMDTTQDEINPKANYYGASAAYKPLYSTHDDGGPEGTYTKNFVMDVKIADENISKNDTGSAVFTFGITATQKNGEYPIKVYIAITLDGEFRLNHADSKIMVPQEPLVPQAEYSSTWRWAEVRQYSSGGAFNVFDSDNYKLWPREQGGDGYYHCYSMEKYPNGYTGPFYTVETNEYGKETFRGYKMVQYPPGYGPILYAKIDQANRFMEAREGQPPVHFANVEYQGNKALTLSNGTENYKLFIEGYGALAGSGVVCYFCNSDCPCRLENTCDSVAITGSPGACLESCEKCKVTCRHLPEEAIGKKGYADYTNGDGCYGVTQELKDFLQKYSISQLLFMDGQGYAETHPQYPVFAAEEDQWLFPCGYYE